MTKDQIDALAGADVVSKLSDLIAPLRVINIAAEPVDAEGRVGWFDVVGDPPRAKMTIFVDPRSDPRANGRGTIYYPVTITAELAEDRETMFDIVGRKLKERCEYLLAH